MTESYHVHNAEMVQAEDWGTTQTLLRFKGVSCGHGYGANEVTIFIDKRELKKMIGIIELGEGASNVEPLPEEPPCRNCEHWEPRYVLGNINCCNTYRRMRPSFSCYQPKAGAE